MLGIPIWIKSNFGLDFEISPYIKLNIKNYYLCTLSEARQRRCIIRGLRPVFIPFITSTQGWNQQPSVEELKSLLSSQETLAKEMAGLSLNGGEGTALFTQKRRNFEGKEVKNEARQAKTIPLR